MRNENMAAVCSQTGKCVLLFTCLQFLTAIETKQISHEKDNNWLKPMKHGRMRRETPVSNATDSGTIKVDEDETVEVKQVMDACASNPCTNSGICTQDSEHPDTKFRCACKLGHAGRTCEEALLLCESMKCIRKGDCVSTPSGAICVCDNGEKGRLCEVKMESPGGWASLESVVTDPSRHLLSAIFGLTVVTITIVAVCLCIHCCRAKAKCKKLRESYKVDLQKGIIPTDVPPDLLDVSNAMCKNMFCCCGGKSELLKNDGETVKGSKSKSKHKGSRSASLPEDEQNRTSNSITRPYARLLQRPRDKPTNHYVSGRTGKLSSKLTSSYRSHGRVSGLNMNNSVDYEPIRSRTVRREYPTLRLKTDHQSCYDSVSSDAQRKYLPDRNVRHSPGKNTKKTGKLYTRADNQSRTPTKFSSPKSRYFKKSDMHVSKSPSKSSSNKYPFGGDKDNYEHSAKKSYYHKFRDGYLSSNSEEEICHYPVRKHDRVVKTMRAYRNRNTNTNPSENSTVRNDLKPNLTPCETVYLYSEPIMDTLSPDAKRNVCANNSLSMEPAIEALTPCYFGYDAETVSVEKETKYNGDHSVVYSDAYSKLYDTLPPASPLDRANEDIEERNGESLNNGEEEASEMFRTAERQTVETVVMDDITTVESSEIYGALCMRVDLPDALNESVAVDGTVMIDNQVAIDDTMNNRETNSSSSFDIPKEHPGVGGTYSEDREPSEVENDGSYVKCFEDDGKTLYYVTGESLVGRHGEVDNDIEVIPDGKGSLLVVSKTVENEDNRETVIEVGKAVNIDTTEEDF